MRFRIRHNGDDQRSATAVMERALNGSTPSGPGLATPDSAPPEGTPAAASTPPPPAPLSVRLSPAPMKSQMSGSDVRTERVARQLRAEIDGLRASVALFQSTPDEFTEVDPAAVAADPEAAAALPPALLVRAIVAVHAENERLGKRLSKQRGRIDKLETQVRDLKQERAWLRGRQQTLDDVIGALHANIEDLRLHRDALPAPQSPARKALHQPGNGLLEEGGCEALG